MPKKTKKEKELRVGSVAYNRLHGLNKAAGGPGKAKEKAQSFQKSSPAPRPGSVAAKQQAPAGPSSKMDKFNQYWDTTGRQERLDREAAYRENNPTAGSVVGYKKWSDLDRGENGLYNWDSTKPVNSFQVDKLKEFGFQGGEMMFDPDKFKSIHKVADTDGRLDAHGLAQGYAVPLNTASPEVMAAHNRQMDWNERLANADGNQLASSEGLYQDGYWQSEGHAPQRFVGDKGQSMETINDAQGETLKDKINWYIRNGGYAGDALKHLDEGGHTANLKNEADIRWYNTIVDEARNTDLSQWSDGKEGSSRNMDPRGVQYGAGGGADPNVNFTASGPKAGAYKNPNTASTGNQTGYQAYQYSSNEEGSQPKRRFNPYDNMFTFDPQAFNFNQ